MEAKEDILNCPICCCGYDPNSNPPLVPPCGHTICQSCVKHFIDINGSVIICPMCKLKFNATDNSKIIIPKNFTLIDVIENFHKLSISENQKQIPKENATKKSIPKYNPDNKNSIFLKNLKFSTTLDQINKVFSIFGDIVSSSIQKPKDPNNQFTQFAVVCYKWKDSAYEAIAKGPGISGIQNLFEFSSHYNNGVYIGKFHPKPIEEIRPPPKREYKKPKFHHRSYNNHSNNPKFQNKMQKRPLINEFKPRDCIFKDNRKVTKEMIRDNIEVFNKLGESKKLDILGNLLFPLVSQYLKNKANQGKVTGMLIDLEVFQLQEIVNFFFNSRNLKQQVDEAEILLEENE